MKTSVSVLLGLLLITVQITLPGQTLQEPIWILSSQYDDIKVHPFNSEIFFFLLKGKWGMTDLSGQVLADPKFYKIEGYNSKYVKIYVNPDINNEYSNADLKCGIMDVAGRILVEPQYADVAFYNYWLYAVKTDSTWSIINAAGIVWSLSLFDCENPLKTILREKMNHGELEKTAFRMFNGCKVQLLPVEGEQVVVLKMGNYYGVLDTVGKLLTDIKYTYIYPDIVDNRLFLFDETEWSCLNVANNQLVTVPFKKLFDFVPAKQPFEINISGSASPKPIPHFSSHDGMLIPFEDNGEAGFIKADLNVTVSGFQKVNKFNGSYAAVEKEGLWGLIDSSGQWKLNPRYEGLSKFDSSSFYEVRIKGKYGIIDVDGKIIVQPRYDRIQYYRNNYYLVTLNEKKGIIYVKGSSATTLIETKYDEITIEPKYQLASVQSNNLYGAVSLKNGTELLNCQYSYLRLGARQAVVKNGNTIKILNIFDNKFPEDFYASKYQFRDSEVRVSEGIISINCSRTATREETFHGYVGPTGEIYSFEDAFYVCDFSEGLGAVLYDGDPKRKRIEFIDANGNVVLKVLVSSLPYTGDAKFKNGLIKLEVSHKTRLLAHPLTYRERYQNAQQEQFNKYGFEWYVRPKGEPEAAFSEGLAYWVKPSQTTNSQVEGLFGEQRGFFNKEGALVIPTGTFQNDENDVIIHNPNEQKFQEGKVHYYSKRYDKYGFIDRKGNVVIEPQFTFVRPFSEGFCVGVKNGKFQLFDSHGGAHSKQYDWLAPFSEGLAFFIDGSSMGYLDHDSRELFRRDHVLVCSSKGSFYSDIEKKYWLKVIASMDGDKRPKIKYPDLFINAKRVLNTTVNAYSMTDTLKNEFFEANFHNGRAMICQNNLYGFINKMGEVIIPPRYKAAGIFSEGLAAVQNAAGLWGYIDSTGNQVINFQYSLAQPFSESLAAVQRNSEPGFWGYIDKSGVMVIRPHFSYAEPFVGNVAKVCTIFKEDETYEDWAKTKPYREQACGYITHPRGSLFLPKATFLISVGLENYSLNTYNPQAVFPSIEKSSGNAFRLLRKVTNSQGSTLDDRHAKALVNENATKKNILQGLLQMAGRMQESDLLIFYFSGYGQSTSLFPYDYDPSNPRKKAQTDLTIREIIDSLKNYPGQKLLFLDIRPSAGENELKKEDVIYPPGIYSIINTSDGTEGINFSNNFLKALDADGDLDYDRRITLLEVLRSLKKQTGSDQAFRINQAQNARMPEFFLRKL